MVKLEKFVWKPIVPFCLLTYFALRAYSDGISSFRAYALFCVIVWLSLAVYDVLSKGKFTAWLYSDDG